MGSSRQLRPRSLFKSTRSLARSVSLAIGRTNKPTGKRYTHSVSSLCLISKCGLAKEPARRWLCRFWKQRQKCFVRWRPSIPPMFPAQFLSRSRPMNETGPISVVRRQIDIFLAAVMFLTRLPVGRFHRFRDEDLAYSTLYFPVVGSLIGLACGLALIDSAGTPTFFAVL